MSVALILDWQASDPRIPVCLKVAASILRARGYSLPVIAEVLGCGTHKWVRDALRQVEATSQLQRLAAVLTQRIQDSPAEVSPLNSGDIDSLRSWLEAEATPDQRRRTVIARVGRGESLRSIATDLELSYERVRQLSGGARSDRSARAAELQADILRRLKAGIPPADIAADLRVRERVVRSLNHEITGELRRERAVDLSSQAVALARAGSSNAQIAHTLGVSISFVRAATRAELGPRQRPPFDRQRARELYDKGFPDTVIARELGYSIEPIRLWRVRQGLPANARGRPTR